MSKIAICPDIHGRTFWKQVQDRIDEFDKVIFLGDYLDPYDYEWPKSLSISEIRDITINNFKEIIEFKKKYSDKVILLLGNHDCGYLISRDICSCRSDRLNYNIIRDLFITNKDLFQLGYRENNTTFTHAGLRDWWVNIAYKDTKFSSVIDTMNNEYILYDPNNSIYDSEGNAEKLPAVLSCVSYYRGGYYQAGSVVWADIQEPISENFGYQIFGHTQLEDCCITDKWACLDCRRPFILDNQEITEIDGSKISKRTLGKDE